MSWFLYGGLTVLSIGIVYGFFYVLGLFVGFTQKHKFFQGDIIMDVFTNIIFFGAGVVFFLGVAVVAGTSGFKSIEDNYDETVIEVL